MKKRILPLLIAAMLAAIIILPGCQQSAQSKELNLFTWEGYISGDVIDKFTQETGIKVNFLPFTSNEEMLTMLQASNSGEYDVILASDVVLDVARLLSEENPSAPLMQKLDKSKLPNFKNIDPVYQSQFFDPSNEYIVPYVAGSPLIVYDPSRVDFEITGYNDLWDERLKDSIVVVDDMRMVFATALWSMGESINTKDPEKVRAAGEKLMSLKPNIRAFDYETPHMLMISGEASVGFFFTPFVVMTLNERPDFKVIYPKERLGYGIDGLFIAGGAKNVDNAHLFLDFLMRGDISAQCSMEQLYMNCNQAAREYLPEEYYSNEAMYVPNEFLMDAEMMQDVGDVTPLFDSLWVEFKNQ